MNHSDCYLQGPGSNNIADFAINLTTSGMGKVRLASHKRPTDPLDVAFQRFARNTEDLFCFAIALTPPFPALVLVEDFFCSEGLKTFFCSLTHWWQLFGCSTFPQVALSKEILPSLRLPSFKSSIHNNDSHMVRFFRSSKLCCPDAKPQCYSL